MLNHFSCVLILCDLLYYSQPGSSIHGIFQARILVWIAFPSLGDLPYPEMELASLMSPALAGSSLPLAAPGKLIGSWPKSKLPPPSKVYFEWSFTELYPN